MRVSRVDFKRLDNINTQELTIHKYMARIADKHPTKQNCEYSIDLYTWYRIAFFQKICEKLKFHLLKELTNYLRNKY